MPTKLMEAMHDATSERREVQSIVSGCLWRAREEVADIPDFVRARDLLFDGFEAGVKTLTPTGEVSACVFVGEALALAMAALHCEDFGVFYAWCPQRETQAIRKFAQRAQYPVQGRRVVDADAASWFIPGHLPVARNDGSMSRFPA